VVSRKSLQPLDDNAPEVMTTSSLEEYLVRQLVGDIVRMMIEIGIICIDFADVQAIMCDGRSDACLGGGIANGERPARDAARKALQSLWQQQVDPAQSAALLVWITGSTNITMDDFDAASTVIHEAIHEEADIIVGLLIDDALAENIRVSILAKGGGVASPKEKTRLHSSFFKEI